MENGRLNQGCNEREIKVTRNVGVGATLLHQGAHTVTHPCLIWSHDFGMISSFFASYHAVGAAKG
ncbi:MAG: hypothetical protein M3O06_02210, partial [Pseudomonadota bacterium]|nr:hypothetical protein [Pseudomonadota bacterium]